MALNCELEINIREYRKMVKMENIEYYGAQAHAPLPQLLTDTAHSTGEMITTPAKASRKTVISSLTDLPGLVKALVR